MSDFTVRRGTVSWNDIDKYRFFSVGTLMYSGLTILLHPLTVVKVRQQVQNDSKAKPIIHNDESKVKSKLANQHDNLKRSRYLRNNFFFRFLDMEKFRYNYRGLGTVVTIAVPTRALYITVLENCKAFLSEKLVNAKENDQHSTLGPILQNISYSGIAAISGGLSGGLASFVSQVLVVPMDVISQRQMITGDSASTVYQSLIKEEGFSGFYRGFGISLMLSLPAGSAWWATYTASQQLLQDYSKPMYLGIDDEGAFGEMNEVGRQLVIQIISGINAAIAATAVSQPLDVIKTRLQVGGNVANSSISAVVNNLVSKEGLKGFYRGSSARIMNISVWGTIISTAYEYLKFISIRKD